MKACNDSGVPMRGKLYWLQGKHINILLGVKRALTCEGSAVLLVKEAELLLMEWEPGFNTRESTSCPCGWATVSARARWGRKADVGGLGSGTLAGGAREWVWSERGTRWMVQTWGISPGTATALGAGTFFPQALLTFQEKPKAPPHRTETRPQNSPQIGVYPREQLRPGQLSGSPLPRRPRVMPTSHT